MKDEVNAVEALTSSFTLQPSPFQRERDFDGAARGDDAPALAVNLHVGQALGRVHKYALDLLRRQGRVGFEHAGDRRGDDGRGERGSVNELVVLAYHVRFAKLDGDELAY